MTGADEPRPGPRPAPYPRLRALRKKHEKSARLTRGRLRRSHDGLARRLPASSQRPTMSMLRTGYNSMQLLDALIYRGQAHARRLSKRRYHDQPCRPRRHRVPEPTYRTVDEETGVPQMRGAARAPSGGGHVGRTRRRARRVRPRVRAQPEGSGIRWHHCGKQRLCCDEDGSAQAHLHSSSTISRPMRAISSRTASCATSLTDPSCQASSSASRRRRRRTRSLAAVGIRGASTSVTAHPFMTDVPTSGSSRSPLLHGTCHGRA